VGMWKFFMCSMPLREEKCSCTCVSHGVANMYEHMIGPFISFAVCS